MPRERKPETIIKQLTRDMKEKNIQLSDMVHDLNVYRQRATKAEQDAADWKRRFDALLKVTLAPRVETE